MAFLHAISTAAEVPVHGTHAQMHIHTFRGRVLGVKAWVQLFLQHPWVRIADFGAKHTKMLGWVWVLSAFALFRKWP